MRFVFALIFTPCIYLCLNFCAVDSNPECLNRDDNVNNPNRHLFCVEYISLDMSLSPDSSAALKNQNKLIVGRTDEQHWTWTGYVLFANNIAVRSVQWASSPDSKSQSNLLPVLLRVVHNVLLCVIGQ